MPDAVDVARQLPDRYDRSSEMVGIIILDAPKWCNRDGLSMGEG